MHAVIQWKKETKAHIQNKHVWSKRTIKLFWDFQPTNHNLLSTYRQVFYFHGSFYSLATNIFQNSFTVIKKQKSNCFIAYKRKLIGSNVEKWITEQNAQVN